MARARFDQVAEATFRERRYQDKKHGTIERHSHAIAEWTLIMRDKLAQAEAAWMKDGDDAALQQVFEAVATGFACLEQHGWWAGHDPAR